MGKRGGNRTPFPYGNLFIERSICIENVLFVFERRFHITFYLLKGGIEQFFPFFIALKELKCITKKKINILKCVRALKGTLLYNGLINIPSNVVNSFFLRVNPH